ncbi:MAG: ATP-binding protein [Candidatus Nanopelagicales bacterium]
MTQNAVRLSVPAETGWVSLVRSTAVAVASRVGFDLEQLEDVRLAVGEAAGLLAANAVPDTLLEVRFEVEEESVLVAITGHCEGSVLPQQDSFAWAVLAALVVDLWAEETPDGVTISLRSARSTALADPA